MQDHGRLVKYAAVELGIADANIDLIKNAGLFSAAATALKPLATKLLGKGVVSGAGRLASTAGRVLKPTSTLGNIAKSHLKRTALISGMQAAMGSDENHPDRGVLSRFGHNMTNWKYHAAAAASQAASKPLGNLVGRTGLKMMRTGGNNAASKAWRGAGGYLASTSGEAAGALKQVNNAVGNKGFLSNVFGAGTKASGTSQKQMAQMASDYLGYTNKSVAKQIAAKARRVGYKAAMTEGNIAQKAAKASRGAGDMVGAKASRGLRDEARNVAKKWRGNKFKDIKQTSEYSDQFFKSKGFTHMDKSLYNNKGRLQEFVKSKGIDPTTVSDKVFEGGRKSIDNTLRSSGLKTYGTNNRLTGFNVGKELSGPGMIGSLATPIGADSMVAPVLATAVGGIPVIGGYAAKPLNLLGPKTWEPEAYGEELSGALRSESTGNGLASTEGKIRWRNRGGMRRSSAIRTPRYFGR